MRHGERHLDDALDGVRDHRRIHGDVGQAQREPALLVQLLDLIGRDDVSIKFQT